MKFRLPVFLLCLLFAGCFGSPHVVRLGTAPQGGIYYAFGTIFANQLRQDNMVLDVRVTSGSRDNLRLLKENYIKTGIVQSDVLYEDREENTKTPVYSAVASLYSEAVHIVVRSESDIHSLQDLKGKIVAVGEEFSGTCANALLILETAGLSDRDMRIMYTNYDLASQDLMDKRIDAFFMTSGTPNNIVGDIAKNSEIRLIPIEASVLDQLEKTMPCYTRTVITKDTYPKMEEDIETICVTSVLLARNDLPEDTVYKITSRLVASRDLFSRRLKISFTPEAGKILSSISLPLHPGAAGYFRQNP